jgi:hypothetical protein
MSHFRFKKLEEESDFVVHQPKDSTTRNLQLPCREVFLTVDPLTATLISR